MARRRSAGTRQLRTIRKSLKAIDRALRQLGALMRETSSRRVGAVRGVRKLKLSPKRRAALKLQGQYMGYMRQLRPGQKALVKAVKEKRGVVAAIVAAKRLAKIA